MNKKLTMGTILQRLNDLVKPLEGIEIRGFSQFHNRVHLQVEEFIKSLDLECHSWSIQPARAWDLFNNWQEFGIIFTYSNVNPKKDERYTRGVKFTITKIEFNVKNSSIVCFENLTLEEYMDRLKLLDAIEKKLSLDIQIKEAQLKVQELIFAHSKVHRFIEKLNHKLSNKSE
jgi:hypothetical protein